MIIKHAWRFAALLAISYFLIVPAFPLQAQQPDNSTLAAKVEALERRLEELDRISAETRRELEQLKLEAGVQTAAAPVDLTEVETVPAGTAVTEADDIGAVEVVPNDSAGQVSKIFNPDISIIGNVIASAGEDDEAASISLEEAELSLQAYVDPYMKAQFYIGFSDEEVAVEEGYVDFISLPWDLSAKAGKMKAGFGKFNQTHFHTWPWADAPLVMETFFGEEGLADAGVSLTKLIPAGDNLVSLTGEVYRGEVEDVFEPEDRNDLFYLGRARFYGDLSESSNVELGASWARGNLPEAGGSSEFAGVDLTYRWRPLQRAIYNSFLGRTEIVINDRDDQLERAWGFYSSAEYQFARRWSAGVRADYVERPDDPSVDDRGGAVILTFKPSEFSLIRGQYRVVDYGDAERSNEFLLQLQFGIGAHGAHTF